MECHANGKEMEWKNQNNYYILKYFGNGMEWKWNGDRNKMEHWYIFEC